MHGTCYMFLSFITDKYLGNRLLSYGHTLSVSFTAELEELLPRSVTVILEGSGLSATADLYFQQESLFLIGEDTHQHFHSQVCGVSVLFPTIC